MKRLTGKHAGWLTGRDESKFQPFEEMDAVAAS